MSDEENDTTAAVTEAREAPASFGSKLFSSARKAREQAAATAAELKEHAAARAAELKEAGVSRVNESLAELDGALPAVREAGYALAAIEIQIGVPPKIVAKFATPAELSEEKAEALLAEHAERKFTVLLLKALFQASRLQAKVKIGGLKPSGVDVEIGLAPHVTIKFG
jgi:hypothetical protein